MGYAYRINTELVDELIDWIQRNESGQIKQAEPVWDQQLWYYPNQSYTDDNNKKVDCGSTCCVAGYIAEANKVIGLNRYSTDYEPQGSLMAGKVNHLGVTWEQWVSANGLSRTVHDSEGDTLIVEVQPANGRVDWQYMGAFFLGITIQDAHYLFDANNTAETLVGMLTEFKEKYPND